MTGQLRATQNTHSCVALPAIRDAENSVQNGGSGAARDLAVSYGALAALLQT